MKIMVWYEKPGRAKSYSTIFPLLMVAIIFPLLMVTIIFFEVFYRLRSTFHMGQHARKFEPRARDLFRFYVRYLSLFGSRKCTR